MSQSEPEAGNGNVNTVYFIHQARRNTQISHTEFVFLRLTSTRLQMFTLSFQLRMVFVKKIYFYKLAFSFKRYPLM